MNKDIKTKEDLDEYLKSHATEDFFCSEYQMINDDCKSLMNIFNKHWSQLDEDQQHMLTKSILFTRNTGKIFKIRPELLESDDVLVYAMLCTDYRSTSLIPKGYKISRDRMRDLFKIVIRDYINYSNNYLLVMFIHIENFMVKYGASRDDEMEKIINFCYNLFFHYQSEWVPVDIMKSGRPISPTDTIGGDDILERDFSKLDSVTLKELGFNFMQKQSKEILDSI